VPSGADLEVLAAPILFTAGILIGFGDQDGGRLHFRQRRVRKLPRVAVEPGASAGRSRLRAASQLAQGVWWSVFTLAGLGVSVLVYQRRTASASLDAGPDTPGKAPASVAPAAPAVV
jgi:hypothetical protein